MPSTYETLLVFSDEHTRESLHQALIAAAVEDCWVDVRQQPRSADDPPLLVVQLTGLRRGEPLAPAAAAAALSAEGRSALSLSLSGDAEPDHVALRYFCDGEQRFLWHGVPADYLAELPSGSVHRGAPGLAAAVAELTGASWATLLDTLRSDGEPLESTLLLRGRALGVPRGMPRAPQLFYFHVVRHQLDRSDPRFSLEDEPLGMQDEGDAAAAAAEGDADGGAWELPEGDDGDQMAVVLLDAELLAHLWREAPAGRAAELLQAVAGQGAALLGPLVGALEETQAFVNARPAEQPLAGAAAGDELLGHYEILALGTALGYLAGDAVAYYDERFFPLLSLADTPLSAELLHASREEIAELGLLSAMAEVLPYSVPEGELLECFADDELAPLADWCCDGETYEGSLFLLDTARLQQLIERFDGDAFAQRVAAFAALRDEVVPLTGEALERRRVLDTLDETRFVTRLGELQLLLALAQANHLQAAVLFYGA